MSAPDIFSQGYYEAVIKKQGYNLDVFEGFGEDFLSLGREELMATFLCHQGLYDFRDSNGDKSVLTGFGLSGTPHLGTLSQVYRTGLLNEAGVHAEVILGDLDAYNGKQTALAKTRLLADQYKRFIVRSNILDPDNSRVRNQFDSPEVVRTSYLLGRYITDEQFEGAQEDLHAFYAEQGKVDRNMSYRRRLSLNLMIADFFDLGQTHPDVLVMLGLDEHQYVKVAQELSKVVNEETAGLKPVRVHSIYTPIIRGLKGYPKMSKSFPDSNIDMSMGFDEINEALQTEPDLFEEPEDSIVYQIGAGIGTGNEITLAELKAEAGKKDKHWAEAKTLIARRIAGFSRIWSSILEEDDNVGVKV